MKELRFKAHNGAEIWRAAFAFDPERKACMLVAGDKQGQDEAAFHSRLIKTADKRFDMHLRQLAKAKKESPGGELAVAVRTGAGTVIMLNSLSSLAKPAEPQRARAAAVPRKP